MSNDTRDLETRLRQDLGLLDWQVIEIMPVVKRMIVELIGEDEARPQEGPKRNGIDQGLRRTRNKLRAELRKKVQEL